MKRNSLLGAIGAVALVGFLGSCVSLEDKMMTVQERQETEVVGSVTVGFTSYQFFHFPNNKNIKNKAYAELKKAAAREYGNYGNVDVRNIVISGGVSGWEALNIIGSAAIIAASWPVVMEMDTLSMYIAGGAAIVALGIGNTQKITATGDVVSYNAPSRAGARSRDLAQDVRVKLQDAAVAISTELIKTIPKNTTVAVLSIGSDNTAVSETIIDELEFNLVGARQFTIVDRARLDQIRREQNFQLSGDVSNDSAVSIGGMLGANIVIVGTVNVDGSTGRITVRALDTQTAQIVTMARGQF
jgi:TolB-like protein